MVAGTLSFRLFSQSLLGKVRSSFGLFRSSYAHLIELCKISLNLELFKLAVACCELFSA